MPDSSTPDSRPLPSLIPTPDYDAIRRGDRQALEDALRSIVNATNAYIVRKGG